MDCGDVPRWPRVGTWRTPEVKSALPSSTGPDGRLPRGNRRHRVTPARSYATSAGTLDRECRYRFKLPSTIWVAYRIAWSHSDDSDFMSWAKRICISRVLRVWRDHASDCCPRCAGTAKHPLHHMDMDCSGRLTTAATRFPDLLLTAVATPHRGLFRHRRYSMQASTSQECRCPR